MEWEEEGREEKGREGTGLDRRFPRPYGLVLIENQNFMETHETG